VSAVLGALRDAPVELTAIVTTADDGGSSGDLPAVWRSRGRGPSSLANRAQRWHEPAGHRDVAAAGNALWPTSSGQSADPIAHGLARRPRSLESPACGVAWRLRPRAAGERRAGHAARRDRRQRGRGRIRNRRYRRAHPSAAVRSALASHARGRGASAPGRGLGPARPRIALYEQARRRCAFSDRDGRRPHAGRVLWLSNLEPEQAEIAGMAARITCPLFATMACVWMTSCTTPRRNCASRRRPWRATALPDSPGRFARVVAPCKTHASAALEGVFGEQPSMVGTVVGRGF
jgi:hypothetical protein